MNAPKSRHERTNVWTWTPECMNMNARKSGKRTKLWTWTHECLVNPQSPDINARKSEHERTKVWKWKQKFLNRNAQESEKRTKVWSWSHKFFCTSIRSFLCSCPHWKNSSFGIVCFQEDEEARGFHESTNQYIYSLFLETWAPRNLNTNGETALLSYRDFLPKLRFRCLSTDIQNKVNV